MKNFYSFQRVLLSPVQFWTTFATVECLLRREKKKIGFKWIAATAGTQPSNENPALSAEITATSFLHSAEWCSRRSITNCFRWDCTIIPTPQGHDFPKGTFFLAQESRLPHAHSCWAPLASAFQCLCLSSRTVLTAKVPPKPPQAAGKGNTCNTPLPFDSEMGQSCNQSKPWSHCD